MPGRLSERTTVYMHYLSYATHHVHGPDYILNKQIKKKKERDKARGKTNKQKRSVQNTDEPKMLLHNGI